MAKINVLQKEVNILKISENDFISLTDIAKYKKSDSVKAKLVSDRDFAV